MATKSIQRSLKLIKGYEWQYWITEKWNAYTRRREDMFNFCDILCLDGKRTIAVQATGSDLAKHRDKLKENPFVLPWLTANNELQIWSFRKLKKVRCKKATYWHCKKTDVLLVNNEIFMEERK